MGQTFNFCADHSSIQKLAGALEEIPNVESQIIPRELNKFQGLKACVNLFIQLIKVIGAVLDNPNYTTDNLYFFNNTEVRSIDILRYSINMLTIIIIIQ